MPLVPGRGPLVDTFIKINGETGPMRFLIVFLLWCGLFVLSWPIAVLALLAYPIVWVLCLPFRLVGIAVGAVFALLKAVLFLPARILGARPRPS